MIRPRSLQGRMLALSAVATLVALLVAGWVVAGVLERVVTAGIDRRLDAELAAMTGAVGRDGQVDRALLTRRLGALDMGRGWRWRIAGPAGTVSSADFLPLDGPDGPGRGDSPPPPPPPPGHAARPLDAHDAAGRVHLRQLTIITERGDVTLTAGAPADVVARPIIDALTPLLAVLAALAGVFAAAAVVQLRLGLRPVRRLGDAVAAIRAGTRDTVDENQPTELQPLASELNALVADNRAALTAARSAAANLAHALKTPVATLSLTLAGDPDAAAQIARIDATIRRHLARARTAAIARNTRAALAEIVGDVAATVGALHRGITIDLDLAPDLSVAVDRHDLAEIVGNLADNAARHADARVTIAAQRRARAAWLTIDDDGPGIPAAARDWVMRPGARLDEAPGGDGFGLAIARELIALYGGTLALADAPGGGLRVMLTLPIAG